ncbi:hypothetical protein AOCH_007766 [Aspergillus ochraceoroseus]|uniref:DUF4939 domain-containing protein n=1 Tax=Aspergillus ochraceoroseus TaxID=138278 RepID=A0A0F8USR9_9EURO|nr:hypothetical protein AOCH_007766 [Aspergillus ochraceoroseus]
MPSQSLSPSKRDADVTAPPTTTTALTASVPTAQTSEQLPNPDKFNGQQSDLRCFTSQICQKITMNLDYFLTLNSRMAYMTSHLEGTPYAQILPYIQDRICELSDYIKILEILEKAFGDLNLEANTRANLFCL